MLKRNINSSRWKQKSLFLESYDEEKLDEILVNEDLFYQYLDMEPAPNDLEESGLTLEQYIDQEYTSYEQYLEFPLILWREPHKCTQQEVEYLKNKITKPYGLSVDEVFAHLEYMQIALKFLLPPSKKGQGPQDITDWNPSLNTIEPKERHEMQYNCMSERFQKDLDNLETDWSDHEKMSDQVFIVRKIEIRDRIEQTAQADLKKKYASSPSDDGEVPEPRRNKKQKSYK